MRKISVLFFLVVLVTISFSTEFTKIEGFFYPSPLVFRMPENVEKATCIDVIDGKTIKIKYNNLIGEERIVELIGVNIEGVEDVSKNALTNLIVNEEIYLTYDWSGMENEITKAYVWQHFPTITGGYNLMTNVLLIANGYVFLDTKEVFNEKYASIFYETSENAMQNKYGYLKQYSTEEPILFASLEKEVQSELYNYYWDFTPIASQTDTEVLGGFERKVFTGRRISELTDPFDLPKGLYKFTLTTFGRAYIKIIPLNSDSSSRYIFIVSPGDADIGISKLYEADRSGKVLMEFSGMTESYRLEIVRIEN